jgi:hypothetical protein
MRGWRLVTILTGLLTACALRPRVEEWAKPLPAADESPVWADQKGGTIHLAICLLRQ